MQSQVDGMIAATRALFDLSADRKKAMAAALSPLYRGACTCNNQSVSQSVSQSEHAHGYYCNGWACDCARCMLAQRAATLTPLHAPSHRSHRQRRPA